MNKAIFLITIIAIFFLSVFVLAYPLIDSDSAERTTFTTKQCGTNLCNLIIYGGEMNRDNGIDIIPINTTIKTSNHGGYSSEMTNGLYDAYFKNNLNSGEAVRFEKDGYYFIYDLSGGKMQFNEQPGNPTKTKSIGSMQSSIGNRNKNKMQYDNAFSNTNVRYVLENEMLKEYFILSELPSGSLDYMYLEYTGEIKHSPELTIYANGETKTNKNFQTNGTIEFRNQTGDTIFYLPEPVAWDSNGSVSGAYYNIKVSDTKIQFGLRVSTTWLNNVTYPVYIDPTIKIDGAESGVLEDVGVYYSGSNNKNQSITFIKFNISSIPEHAVVDKALLYMKSFYSGQTTWEWSNSSVINISRVTNYTWAETDLPSNLSSMSYDNTIQQSGKWSNGTYFELNEWDYLNITGIVGADYKAGKSNCTFRIETEPGIVDTMDSSSGSETSLYFGDSSLTNGLIFYSKEYSTVSSRPYLNVTYSILTIDVTLVSPIDTFITNTQTQGFSTNATATIGRELSNATLYIWNSTGDIIFTNTTNLTGNSNSTILLGNVTEDGTYTWNYEFFDNESFSQFALSNYTFTLETDFPAINLDNPANSIYLDNGTDIYFNFTATDTDGLDECQLWGNWTGTWHKNYTWTSLTSAVQNYTTVTISDSNSIWNIWCNDSIGNGGFSIDNYTIVIDTILPNISIGVISTTLGSQTISFTNNVSDININTCKYSIFDSNGTINGLNENVSFTCGSSTQATVTEHGTYNLTIYAVDLALNENSSTSSFTTSPTTDAGGVGSASITIGVGVLEATNFSITTTNLRSSTDVSLAKDTVKERRKDFIITNEGIDPIEVEIICSTENSSDSSFIEGNLSICDFVKLSDTTAIISAIEEDRFEGYFEILPPTNSKIGDEFFFNIFVIRETEEGSRFSKLSVSARLTSIAILNKWSYMPGQADKENEEKNSYPVWVAALLLALTLFILIVVIFKKKELILSGFFVGLGIFIISFILLLLIL